MSNISVNTITDALGGSTASINGLTPQASNMAATFNRIINGAMTIDQRNAGAAVSPMAGGYGVDRWKGSYLGGASGRFSAQQSSNAPTGFNNSWLITVTTADASPSSDHGYQVQQAVEGYNVSDLNWGTANAKTVTVSFWVYSSIAGTFPLLINNSDSSRLYGGTYTVSSANTWTQASVTITGDISGTWLTTNGNGLNVIFGFGGGASRTISTGWQSGSGSTPTNVTGCTQLIANSGATFYITGVQLEAGSTASSFAYENYSDTLQKCQRYYHLLASYGVGGYGSGVSESIFASYQFKVNMRASPTVTITSNGTESNLQSFSVVAVSTDTVQFQAASSSTGFFGVYGSTAANAVSEL
jgi:hypothetical protein